jgi:hypothetical protein
MGGPCWTKACTTSGRKLEPCWTRSRNPELSRLACTQATDDTKRAGSCSGRDRSAPRDADFYLHWQPRTEGPVTKRGEH